MGQHAPRIASADQLSTNLHSCGLSVITERAVIRVGAIYISDIYPIFSSSGE